MKIVTRTYRKGGEEYEETLTTIKKDTSPRGFGSIQFLDSDHQECILQDSSLATEPAIRLGVVCTGPYMSGPSGLSNEKVLHKMHLTQAMVKQLLPYLQEFAKSGEYIAEMDFSKPKATKKKKKTKNRF